MKILWFFALTDRMSLLLGLGVLLVAYSAL